MISGVSYFTFFLVTFRETKDFITRNKLLLLDSVDILQKKKKKSLHAWLQCRLWVDKQCPLMGRMRHAVATWTKTSILPCLFKNNRFGGTISFLFKPTLITSNLKNRNAFLEMLELTHLETANTPPFMEPKQERATKIGTANEKFPSSRSEKV